MSKTVLFQTIQFSMSTQFKCQKQIYFKQVQFLYSENNIYEIIYLLIHLFIYFWHTVKWFHLISNNSV